MQTTSTVSDSIQGYLKRESEPQWLKEYREKNALILGRSPLKKIMYYNIARLNEMVEKPLEPQAKLEVNAEGGVKIFSFSEAIEKFPQKVRAALEAEVPAKNQFEAFINAWFNSGFVAVVKGTFEKPLEIETVFSGSEVAKGIIIAESETNAKIVEKVRGEKKVFYSQTLFTEQNCSVSRLCILSGKQDGGAMLFQQNVLGRDSKLVNSNAWLEGTLVHSNTFNVLSGEGSEVKHLDFSLLSGTQLFDLNNTALRARCNRHFKFY
jgi:Fe-S cluster assembly scaffold protein SufB